jgi:hypothetical protein
MAVMVTSNNFNHLNHSRVPIAKLSAEFVVRLKISVFLSAIFHVVFSVADRAMRCA